MNTFDQRNIQVALIYDNMPVQRDPCPQNTCIHNYRVNKRRKCRFKSGMSSNGRVVYYKDLQEKQKDFSAPTELGSLI